MPSAHSRLPRASAVFAAALLAWSLPLAAPRPAAAAAVSPAAVAPAATQMDPIAYLPQNPRSKEIKGPRDLLGAEKRGLEVPSRNAGPAPRPGETPSTQTGAGGSGTDATFNFSGRVVDPFGNGIEASMFIRPLFDWPYQGGTTNPDGTFSFPLEPGSYAVQLTNMAGHFDGAWGPAGFGYLTGAVDPLVISASDVTAEIIVPDTVWLYGRVTGGGAGLPNVEVDVFLETALAGVVSTDASGYWELPVIPGAYEIGYYTGGTAWGDGWLGPSGYVTSFSSARLVSVATKDVNLGTTALPATKTVSGKAVDNYNLGIDTAQVEAWVNGEFYALVVTGSAGGFSVKVPPGSVKLWMFDMSGRFAPGWRTSTGLTSNPASAAVTNVTTSNVSGLTIKSKDARYIEGKVFSIPSPGSEETGINVWVEAQAFGLAASFAVSDAQGHFYLPTLDGTYRIWSDGRLVDDQWAGGYYRSGTTITPRYSLATTVTSSSVPKTANIQTVRSGALTGIVLDDYGFAIPSVDVQAFVSGEFYTDAVTDIGGVYHHKLLPATYRLAFVDLAGHFVVGWLGPSGFVEDYASAKDLVVVTGFNDDLSINLPIDNPPAAPTGVTAIPYHESAGVSWLPVAATPNRPIIHYTATASPGGATCTAIGATTCIVPGLTNGSPYTFEVTAASIVGTSGLSSASSAVQPHPVPEAPFNVDIVDAGSTIQVSWAAPDDNGSAITGYTATATPGGKTCSTTGATECTISAVPDGLYTVRVTATNAVGAGPPSSPSGPARVDVTAPTATAPVSSISAGSATGSTIPVRLSWSGSDAGTGIDHYQVWESTNGGSYVLIGNPTTAAFTTSESPSTTTTHRYRVRAFDENGNASGYVYGPTIKVKRVQQGATGVSYVGTWTTVSTSSASGGSYRYAATAGRSVSYTFTGRTIAVIAHKGSSMGSVRIYLDGVLKATVSQYATSTQWQRVIYSLNVSSGTHTIRLVCVGTAGHPRISIDAFAVIQ